MGFQLLAWIKIIFMLNNKTLFSMARLDAWCCTAHQVGTVQTDGGFNSTLSLHSQCGESSNCDTLRFSWMRLRRRHAQRCLWQIPMLPDCSPVRCWRTPSPSVSCPAVVFAERRERPLECLVFLQVSKDLREPTLCIEFWRLEADESKWGVVVMTCTWLFVPFVRLNSESNALCSLILLLSHLSLR